MRAPSTTIQNTFSGDFRELVEAHQSRVYSIAYRILHDVGTAEEVSQDVFVALYRNLARIESDQHLLAWLRRVAVQRATDAYRRRTGRVDFAAEEFCEERLEVVPNAGFAANAPGSSNTASVESIEQLIATLPPAQRAIVLLRYQEDMTPTEIAASLSMPLGTVKSHLQRALRVLRAQALRQRKEAMHG